jgi:hypothetical protein
MKIPLRSFAVAACLLLVMTFITATVHASAQSTGPIEESAVADVRTDAAGVIITEQAAVERPAGLTAHRLASALVSQNDDETWPVISRDALLPIPSGERDRFPRSLRLNASVVNKLPINGARLRLLS